MEITAFSFAKLGKGSNELIMEVGSGSHIAYLLKQEPHFLLFLNFFYRLEVRPLKRVVGISAEEADLGLKGNNYKCTMCDPPLIINTKSAKNDHVKKVHNGYVSLCDFCDHGISLGSKAKISAMAEHRLKFHGVYSKEYPHYKCTEADDCSFKTCTKWLMIKHVMSIHMGLTTEGGEKPKNVIKDTASRNLQ